MDNIISDISSAFINKDYVNGLNLYSKCLQCIINTILSSTEKHSQFKEYVTNLIHSETNAHTVIIYITLYLKQKSLNTLVEVNHILTPKKCLDKIISIKNHNDIYILTSNESMYIHPNLRLFLFKTIEFSLNNLETDKHRKENLKMCNMIYNNILINYYRNNDNNSYFIGTIWFQQLKLISELYQVINEIINNSNDKYNDNLKQENELLKKNIEKLNQEEQRKIENLNKKNNNEIETLKRQITNEKHNISRDIQSYTGKIDDLEKEKNSLKNIITNYDKKYKECNEEIHSLRNYNSSIKLDFERINNESERLKNENEYLKSEIMICNNKLQQKESELHNKDVIKNKEIEMIKQKLEMQMNVDRETIQNQLTLYELQNKELNNKYANLNENCKRLMNENQSLREKITKGEEKESKSLKLESNLHKRDEEIEEKTQEIERLHKLSRKCTNELNDYVENERKLKNKMKNLENNLDECERSKKEVEVEYDKLREKYNKLNKMYKDLENINSEKGELEKTLGQRDIKLKQLLLEMRKNEETMNELKEIIDKGHDKFQKQQLELQRKGGDIESLKNELITMNEEKMRCSNLTINLNNTITDLINKNNESDKIINKLTSDLKKNEDIYKSDENVLSQMRNAVTTKNNELSLISIKIMDIIKQNNIEIKDKDNNNLESNLNTIQIYIEDLTKKIIDKDYAIFNCNSDIENIKININDKEKSLKFMIDMLTTKQQHQPTR